MGEGEDRELLLGKHTPAVQHYAPQLLYPIARSDAREKLGLAGELPFTGVDVWHAYELSWLDGNDRPVARVGRFSIDAASPNIVESKSFKLYLNSLNGARFADVSEAMAIIVRDISDAAGAPVELQLYEVDDSRLSGARLPGTCIDHEPAAAEKGEPDGAMLQVREAVVEEKLYSHLLRSLCPVTGQPDWASVWVHYRGPALERSSLLRYLLAYRQHQEFHEQCAERMFSDLHNCLQPEFLHLQACYTRRGGLDINPFRSTSREARPLPRMARQ